jgi:hypothetical protein
MVAMSAVRPIGLAVAAEYPTDSVVVWFKNGCNQKLQARAFNTIVQNLPYQDEAFSMVEVKPQYDVPAVRDAFGIFVRSITVANRSDTCGDAWNPSLELGSPDPSDTSEDEYVPPLMGMILSLYVNLGLTDDLYPIADSLYDRMTTDDQYFAYVWEQMGAGYFQYLLDNTLHAQGYTEGVRIASYYLNYFHHRGSTPAQAELAVAIHDSASLSTEVLKRRVAASFIPEIYSYGYKKLNNAIVRLLADPDDKTRNDVHRRVKHYQKSYHIMAEFKLDQ